MSLSINTLGRTEISWNGEPVAQLSLRKSQALLIYLALNPGTHDRSHLAGLLWADLPEQNARRNLRHALHRLRSALDPDVLESDRLSAGLNPDQPCRVDALDFEEELAHAGRHRRAGDLDAAVRYLEAAAEIYQGDFLADFVVTDCLAFEEWAAGRRAHLRIQFLDGLDTLVRHWTLRGAYGRALDYARRQLAQEPLAEKSHRQLITLLALDGRRNAALAQYHACRRLLQQELGVEPLAETTSLYHAIRNADVTALQAPHTSQATYESPDLPFVGREEEHAKLVSAWESARYGAGQLTLVEGEAGVGKSRLVEEVLRLVEAQGAAVLRGRCYEFGGGVPYQPVAEALRAYFVDKQWKLPPIWLAELARLLPDLHEIYADLPELDSPEGAAAPQRLFEAVTRLLLSICEDVPALCIFLDDLHWADQATLDLVHYLLRHLHQDPIWFVVTYRPEETSLSHPLTRLRQGLSRDRRVARLLVKPLSGAAVQFLARSLVGEQQADALSDFLYRESDGNPFMLVETVNVLQEEGALAPSDAHPVRSQSDSPRWIWSGDTTQELLPLSVRDIILQRVGRLGMTAQRLLTLASVIGQPFDATLLQAASDLDAHSVDRSLDRWLSRRLVRLQSRTSDYGAQYDFSHDKVRAVVYRAASPDERRRLHRKVGEVFDRRFVSQIEQHVASLAYHWEQGGEPDRAAKYLVQAGDQARLVYAHGEAVDYYRRALAMLEQLGEDGREESTRTLMKLGLAYHHTFDYTEARDAYEKGFSIWQQRSVSPPAADLPSPPHRLRVRWLEPTTLDPAMSPDNHTSSMLMQLFSGLVTLSPEMNILPDIAGTWDVSEDGRRYVFHLRDDVRWSDGEPVTAGDFEYAWKRTLDPRMHAPAAGFLFDIRGAKAFHNKNGSRDEVGVHAPDATTLIVELEEPTGHFLQLLVRPDYFPVPRHVAEAYPASWSQPAHYVTNGPFVLEDWQRGKPVTLTRNLNYHGRFEGNVDRVTLFPIRDWATRIRMYEDDELDLLGISFCPAASRRTIRARHAGEYVPFPILESCYLVFDVNRLPFSDSRVRRAFALATDRQTLAEGVLEGYVAPATGGLVPTGMPGHSAGIGPTYARSGHAACWPRPAIPVAATFPPWMPSHLTPSKTGLPISGRNGMRRSA